jgi:CHASE3 domain sensor protein
MTTMKVNPPVTSASPARSTFGLLINKLPFVRLFKNLSIGQKLNIGFGILVVLTLFAAVASFLGSRQATIQINQTEDLRMPTALASARAQIDLLGMLGDMRVYLALGEEELLESYLQASRAFEADLAELQELSVNFSPESKRHLEELQAAYAEWGGLPEQLFELRDDQLEREPAYRILATDGLKTAALVLIDIQTLIEDQARREPSVQNVELLRDMANFQGSFTAMLSGLRGYVTTRNRIYRQEYEANRDLNDIAWYTLSGRRVFLEPNQQETLTRILQNRTTFLQLPPEMFRELEGEHWREDLFLSRTKALPLTEKMQQLLAEITVEQQELLKADLNRGRQGLAVTNQRILEGGIAALVLGLAMTFIFRENIAGPVRRLTGIAEQIRGGDLAALAQVESRDEIGVLAEAFNSMTTQLRQTLLQVRKEKRRADDLLHVVIPIGVALSSEKNFNRLLENILVEAKKFCRADAGIFYLCTDDNHLRFVIVQNSTLNIAMGGTAGQEISFSPQPIHLHDTNLSRDGIAAQAARIGMSVNIPDAYQSGIPEIYDPGVFDEQSDYRSISHLAIPLRSSANKIIGVLHLINAQDPETNQVIPFDPNLQQMMESFSSLAVAALEAYLREQGLKQEIQQLRIEIDEVKRQKQVEEIVETDFFQDLQAKATNYRRRSSRHRIDQDEAPEDDQA